MLYILALAIAIAIVVFIANSKNRTKAEQLKNSYLKRYESNAGQFSQNDFLSVVFTQLESGNRVAAKDIKEAFDIMAKVEASPK